jgi:hypothetical protein
MKRMTEKDSRTFYFSCKTEHDLEEWAIYLEFAKAKVICQIIWLGDLHWFCWEFREDLVSHKSNAWFLRQHFNNGVNLIAEKGED